MTEPNGWSQYEKLVLDKLDRLTRLVDSLEVRMSRAEAERAALMVKSGAWGLIGSAIPTTVAIVWLLTQR